MFKIVFCDLDGSFLTLDKRVTPANRRALDELAAHGIPFVPCSGRSVNALPKELLAHPSVRHAICANGAVVAEAASGRVLREVDIRKDLVLDLYNELRGLRITFDVFADGTVYAERARFGYVDTVNLSAATRATVKGCRTLIDDTVPELLERCGEVSRLNIFYHTEEEKLACWEAVDARPELGRSSSLPCNVEVMHATANKGTAVEWLCGLLGLDPADAVAFGDASNDLSMIRAVGDGVAMGNALPEVKAQAHHVCPSCEESGVARYLDALMAGAEA